MNTEENSSPSTSPSLDSGQQMLLIGAGLALLTEGLARMTETIAAMVEQNSHIIAMLIEQQQKMDEAEADDALPPPMNSRPS